MAIMSSCHGGADCRCILRSRLPERAGKDWKIMLAVTQRFHLENEYFRFGDKCMYQHARKAPDEMRELHKQFYAYMKKLKEARYEIL